MPRFLVLKEAVEPMWRQLGVPDGVLYVLVAKVVLDGPSVVAVIRKLESGAVAKHVRVDRAAQTGALTSALNELPHRAEVMGLPRSDMNTYAAPSFSRRSFRSARSSGPR